MPILNSNVCKASLDIFQVKVAEHEDIIQYKDLSVIHIEQMFAVALKHGPWWKPADEVLEGDTSDEWSMEGWDVLHKIVELEGHPLNYCRENLLRVHEEYIPRWFEHIDTGRDYVEAMKAVGLPGDSMIKMMFDESRIGFLNCNLDGSDFINYYNPSLITMANS